jgi:succinoglycan biosynthesis protein ExoM
MTSGMTYVIAICTHRREAMLAKALANLQTTPLPAGHTFRLLVVDNAADGSARKVVSQAQQHGLDVSYLVEPCPGLASARNAALAGRRPSENLMFIDDDEWPHANWLRELVGMHLRFPGAIIAGPVLAVAEGGMVLPRSPASFPVDAERGRTCGFGNVLLPAELLDLWAIEFDRRYDFSGGEDTAFCLAAERLGFELRWAPLAVCYESLPHGRQARAYRLRRAVVQAAVFSDVVSRGDVRVRLGRATRQLARLLSASLAIFRATVCRERAGIGAGTIDFFASLGGLAGVVGYLPKRPGG